MTDDIESPAHYDFGMMEAREIIELAIADFRDPTTVYHTASALKYLLRASRKNGADDIAKARKHVVWAEDAAKAYEKREVKRILAEMAQESQRQGLYDAESRFTQPPNCSLGVSESAPTQTRHPMAAEALRAADEQPCNQPRPFGESAWAVTWPGYQTLVGN